MVEVSIIVPCYNSEKTIERCINSIKNQSFKDFEALIIDDGSTDNTSMIINRLIKDDERFQYYYKENRGLSDARNYALDRFKGQYVSFIDSDDYIEKDFIQSLHKPFKKNKNIKLTVCPAKIIYKNRKKEENITNFDVQLIISSRVCDKLFCKNFFTQENLRFPVKKWYEDLCMTGKIIFNIKKNNYTIINKPLYNYVQNKNSIMHTTDDRIFQIYDVLEEITAYCKKKGTYNNVKEKIEFTYIYHVLYATIFRSSFHKKFSKEMIKKITQKVTILYPEWRKNKYIKKLPFIIKIYITLLKYNQITIIYLLIKHIYIPLQEKRTIS